MKSRKFTVMAKPPDVARSLMIASRAHAAAITAQLAVRGYEDFPFASASLLWLLDAGATRSTILAQRAGVSKQAISQLVRLMERQGYLKQDSDPTDMRAKLVSLTERGEAVKTACVEIRHALNRDLAKSLGATEAERLQSSLDVASALFGDLMQARPR